MITHLEVKPVTIQGMSGFQVQGLYRDCSDSMYEPVAHAAVFRNKGRAEAFLAKAMYINPWSRAWDAWGKPTGTVLSQIDAIQAHVNVYSVL